MLNINCSRTNQPRQLQFVLLSSNEKLDNGRNAHHLRIQFTQLFPQSNNEKLLRRPGIESGSTAWKAAMLITIPPTV